MLLFALRFILLPGHFPLDPLPCPQRGENEGGVPPEIRYSLCSLPESSEEKKIEIKVVWSLAPEVFYDAADVVGVRAGRGGAPKYIR